MIFHLRPPSSCRAFLNSSSCRAKSTTRILNHQSSCCGAYAYEIVHKQAAPCSRISRREASSFGRRADTDNIPLASATARISRREIEGSTITPKERDVFQRLFQNVLDKAQTEVEENKEEIEEMADEGAKKQRAK